MNARLAIAVALKAAGFIMTLKELAAERKSVKPHNDRHQMLSRAEKARKTKARRI